MDLNILFILVGIVVPIWLLWSSLNSKQRRLAQAIDKIPGPVRLPFIGTVYIVLGVPREDIWRKLEGVIHRFWPLFRTWNASIPEVHFIEAEHMELIFRSSVNINKGFVYNFLHPWLGTGLLTSTGQKWFLHRKMITPTFHFRILENFQEVFVEKTQVLVQKLEQEVGNMKGFDISPYITRCTLDIICETAMGTEIRAQENLHSPYVDAVYDISELVIKRMFRPWTHNKFIYSLTKDGKRFKECVNILHSFTNKVIREKKANLKIKPRGQENTQDDLLGRKRRVAFLDLLLEADGAAALSDEEIREEVDTFMFEGHDTTSASLCWTLFLLGNNPDVQDKVFEEQAAIFQGSDRQPNTQDLGEMKYLERVIKESLRLYPSVPLIKRHLTEEVQVGEYTLPAESHATLHMYFAHRNPKYFPNPDVFDPDNFLPERVQGRHPYAYVPFSAGSRNCIGQKFALLEEKTVLSSVLRKYRVRALDKPSDVKLMAELVLRPAGGIRLVIEPR